MLPGAQREAQLPPRNLSHSVSSYRGTMQSESRGMLQELQLQRAAEAEKVRRGTGAEPSGGSSPGAGGEGGGGGMAQVTDVETETSFPFPSSSLPHSPWSSPFFLEGPGASRDPPDDTLRGGGGGGGGAQVETASSIRSGIVQPSRAPTVEVLAPHLLTKSSWTNSSMPLSTPESVEKYRTVQRAETTAHLRNLLSSSPVPSFPRNTSPVQLVSDLPLRADSPLATSSSSKSKGSVNSVGTVTSRNSTASSFAYQIGHNLPDLRLLKQKSKPSQHTIQKPSILKVSGDIKRSPTFYKPKVVADTATLIDAKGSTSPPPQAPLVAHTLPEILRQESFIKGPLCRLETLSLPSKTLEKKMLGPPAEKEKLQDAGRRRLSTSTRDFAHARLAAAPDTTARQLRFENPVSTGWRNAESPPSSAGLLRKLSAEKPRRSSFAGQHLQNRHKKHYHAVTPPEEEPSVTPLHHGDSYFQTFQTFPEGTVPSKEFVPVRTPQPQEQLKKEDIARRRPESEPSPLRSVKHFSSAIHLKALSETAAAAAAAAATAIPGKRKQSGILSFFRKAAPHEESFDEDQTARLDHRGSRSSRTSLATSVGTPATPGILLNLTEDTSSRRRMSSVVPEMQTPSYFNRPRVRRLPSDNTLSPTGLATPSPAIYDDPPSPLPGKGRIRQQNRSSSEQLSPLGTPRARHRPTMESLRSRVSQATIKATPALRMNVRRSSTNKSNKKGSIGSAARNDRKNSVKFVDQSEANPENLTMPDRSQTIWKGKPSTYFVDIRKVSSAEQLQADNKPLETRKPRRWSLVPKFSSMSLSRLSLSPLTSHVTQRLRRTSSRLSSLVPDSSSEEIEAEPEVPPVPKPVQKGRIQPAVPLGIRFSPAELEVTEFKQTPYSQRYHDAKRALQQQIRAFVDEGLNEADDAEGDDELVLGFEQDVPDHFPNSPLCPLNPKHKSGGKAICPLHGRYKKGMPALPQATLPVGRKLISKVSSSVSDQHAGHHMEIVFDTKDEVEPTVKDSVSTSVDIFGMIKEDHHITAKTSILGIDGAVSMRTRATPVYSEVYDTEVCRGRRRQRDPRGSERKRRRRVRMRRA